MAETFLFNVPAPAAGEDAIFSIRLYESVNGIADWLLVDSVLVSALAVDPSGKKRWASLLSDAAMYHMLVSVSEAGLEGVSRLVLPPRPAASLCTIFVSTKTLTGVVAAGVEFIVQLYGTRVALGGCLTALTPFTFTTNEAGFISFGVVKGAKIQIESDLLGKRILLIDTAGKDLIDLATV